MCEINKNNDKNNNEIKNNDENNKEIKNNAENNKEELKETMKAIAKKMLEQKADIELIKTCTGLTEEEINKLKEEKK